MKFVGMVNEQLDRTTDPEERALIELYRDSLSCYSIVKREDLDVTGVPCKKMHPEYYAPFSASAELLDGISLKQGTYINEVLGCNIRFLLAHDDAAYSRCLSATKAALNLEMELKDRKPSSEKLHLPRPDFIPES